ncbi:hypothetical protein ACTI_67090 [Actinoplanes sp. OR16]|nr:hypothetical protein ACTI_67090 [Actinoplanes sp. OR16]
MWWLRGRRRTRPLRGGGRRVRHADGLIHLVDAGADTEMSGFAGWDSFTVMADDTQRAVTLHRTTLGQYEVRNARGGTMTIGVGDGADFTPVELLLAAIGGCTGADVDYITSKRAEPDSFTVAVTADKVRDEAGGNRLTDVTVELRVTFPEGAAGDAAREMLPRAARMSHDRLCTVSRTVELGTPVDTRVEPGRLP